MTLKQTLTEGQIRSRLHQIHTRHAWITEREAKAAWCGGIGARGEFGKEHARLTAETDQLLDHLKALGGTLAFNPA